MAKIVYIKTGITKGRIMLGIEELGECRGYSVTLSSYADLGAPAKLTELDDTVFGSIKYEDECFRAMKKAVSVLAISDKSRRTLESKLITAGFSRDIARYTVDECLSLGYIDEGRQLERLIEREANISLKGRAYIKRKLMSKGYSSSDIDTAIDRLVYDGTVDFHKNFVRLSEKKNASTDEEKRMIKYKYGYGGED